MKKYILMAVLAFFSVSSYAYDVGDTAPRAIQLPLLEGTSAGEIQNTGTYSGKLVYLDFWASWCVPCRQSLPILNEIRQQYSEKNFEVVAVNVDENLEDALRFLEKYPVDYPVLLDPKGTMPSAYSIQTMPTAYLIDGNGTIVYKHVGFKKKDRAEIEAEIKKHLPR